MKKVVGNTVCVQLRLVVAVAVAAGDLEPLVLLAFLLFTCCGLQGALWIPTPQPKLFQCLSASSGSREASGLVSLIPLCVVGINSLCIIT